MGTWVMYGLGGGVANLPGTVVPHPAACQPKVSAELLGGGFLPSVYQGCSAGARATRSCCVSDPAGMDRAITLGIHQPLRRSAEQDVQF